MWRLLFTYGGKSISLGYVQADVQLFALMASILNSTMREGGLSTYTMEWGHIDDYIRMLVKMKVPYEDLYRILARPEAYVDNGSDQASVTGLARLRDFDNHEDRAGFYNLVKLQVIKDAQGMFPSIGLG